MGDPIIELFEQFQQWYGQLNTPRIDVPTTITTAAHAFFDAHINGNDPARAADYFFNQFTPLWHCAMTVRNYDLAELVWQESLAIAQQWEQDHQPVLLHKGTPYYFWGGTAIIRGNIRKGFLLMHAALAEDKRKHHRADEDPDSAARKFVTLDARAPDQALRYLVQKGTQELEKRLTAYRETCGSTLQFSELQSRYIAQYGVREIIFVFTMAVFEAINLRESFMIVAAGTGFGAQLAANCFFDLCQVIEESLRIKFPSGKNFKHLAEKLAGQHGWEHSPDPLGCLNRQQQTDFEATVQRLIHTTATAGGRKPTSALERDLWLTYVVRNSTAHSLASKQILQNEFDAIYQSMLNVLFDVVNTLYTEADVLCS